MSYGSADAAMDIDFTPDQGSRNKADEHLFVKFFYEMRPDKSYEGTGRRPIKEVEYYNIRVPGSTDSVGGPVTEAIKARFPAHYDAFKRRVEPPVEGTPLKDWPGITRDMVENLSFVGVKTIEQLANLADSAASNLRGVTGFKQKAAAYLEATKGDEVIDHMTEQLEERDKTIVALNEKVDALTARFDELAAGDTKMETPKRRVKVKKE